MHVKLVDESPLPNLYWEMVGARLVAAGIGGYREEGGETRRATADLNSFSNPQWEQLIRRRQTLITCFSCKPGTLYFTRTNIHIHTRKELIVPLQLWLHVDVTKVIKSDKSVSSMVTMETSAPGGHCSAVCVANMTSGQDRRRRLQFPVETSLSVASKLQSQLSFCTNSDYELWAAAVRFLLPYLLTAPLGYTVFPRRDGAFNQLCPRRVQQKKFRLGRNINVENYEHIFIFYISEQNDYDKDSEFRV